MTKQLRAPPTLLQVPSRLLAWAPRALLLILHPRPRAQHSPAAHRLRELGARRGSVPLCLVPRDMEGPGPAEKGEPATRSLETMPSSARNDTLSTAREVPRFSCLWSVPQGLKYTERMGSASAHPS